MRRFLFLAALMMTSTAYAANSATHAVTVTVAAINEVSVSGGALTLTINTATAGSNPDDATDSESHDLLWTTNEASKKITVETDLVSPTFTLAVNASSVSGGTSAGSITTTTTAQDFVTGVATTIGSCDLAYTASATAAEGTGSDAHTITYTLIAV